MILALTYQVSSFTVPEYKIPPACFFPVPGAEWIVYPISLFRGVGIGKVFRILSVGEGGVVAMANIKKKTEPSLVKRTLGREEGEKGLEEAGYCVCAVCIIPPLLLGDLTTVLV